MTNKEKNDCPTPTASLDEFMDRGRQLECRAAGVRCAD
jgi:hypothetical protein